MLDPSPLKVWFLGQCIPTPLAMALFPTPNISCVGNLGALFRGTPFSVPQWMECAASPASLLKGGATALVLNWDAQFPLPSSSHSHLRYGLKGGYLGGRDKSGICQASRTLLPLPRGSSTPSLSIDSKRSDTREGPSFGNAYSSTNWNAQPASKLMKLQMFSLPDSYRQLFWITLMVYHVLSSACYSAQTEMLLKVVCFF